MAVIRINADGSTPVPHGRPTDLDALLNSAAQHHLSFEADSASTCDPTCDLHRGAFGRGQKRNGSGQGSVQGNERGSDLGEGPVVVMIHGFKYEPGNPYHCPHRHILSLEPDHLPWRAPSWPRQLGFGLGQADEGLAIAFGWNARGGFFPALARTEQAGAALAQVLSKIHAAAPHRPIHMIGHSLGTKVALDALTALPAGSVSRIISLSGAMYRSQAEAALATPAGRCTEFINVTTRENDPFDFLFERLAARPRRGDLSIGYGLTAPNAVTLQLDCLATLSDLQEMGHDIGLPEHRICHWSSYMRPGALRFYKRLIRTPGRTPLEALQRIQPERPAPRWSRLLNPGPLPAPMPIWQRI